MVKQAKGEGLLFVNQGSYLVFHGRSLSAWRAGCLRIVVAHTAYIATSAKRGPRTGDDDAAHIVAGL